ncbi:MAG: methylated-DNA--[protein]-cysteine S-methyltransferase [Acidobacteria bacterium]|nr:methylated-DNA--[protein]-cysteine S-methyltransferase [Acidobacteriota bacterium]
MDRHVRRKLPGNRSTFDLLLGLNVGTPFRRRAWRELQRIPYGETIFYGELARRIGKPTASRAVGGANHHNGRPGDWALRARLPFLVACRKLGQVRVAGAPRLAEIVAEAA